MTRMDFDATMSRRKLIGTGAALGAGLSLPGWTWAASESVAGVGSGIPPWEVWDPEADAVVAAVIDRGELPMVNELLKKWTKNGQALPAGLPADLHAFIEKARKLPSWTDTTKLKRAVEFNKRRGTYLGVGYGFVSGMMSCAIPHEARAVYYSKGGADMKSRISKTAKLGYDIGSAGAFHDPNGEMIVTCVKTRMSHAGVRYWLPKSPYWRNGADEPGGLPISQRDILITWHSLPTSVMRSFKKWGVYINSADSAAFLHSWQVAGHMLGIRDEYIPATWSAAESQAKIILDPIVAPTEEGAKLAQMLLNLAAEVDGGILSKPLLESLTRYFLGNKIADWLGVRRNPFDLVIALGWPLFVAAKEASLWFAPGLSKELWNFFDEFLRVAALLYLGEGKKLLIQIPDMNNPNYPSDGGGSPSYP